MSPTQRLCLAHRAANQAIAELCCADNEMSAVQAARLISRACHAVVRDAEGSEAAAEVAYRQADELAVTP